MSDDLLGSLRCRKRDVLPRVARRAPEEAQLPAEVRSIIDKIKGGKRSECGQRKSGNA
jgi:hypothetical protein